MEHPPRVSVIILTYNSAETIGRCLEAVDRLDYPPDQREVLVLDNGSSDRTIEIVTQFGHPCHILPDFNLSELRNYGADTASGEIIAYVDSDCVVAPDWLKEIVKWFSDPAVGIVGNEYLLPEEPTYFEKNWYSRCNYGIKEDDLIPAGNMAINKEYFQRLGGFDKDLRTGEDDYILDLFRHHGLKTISDHRVRSKHLGNAKTLLQYFRKEVWYGLGMLGTVRFTKLNKPLIATALFCLFLIAFPLCLLLYAATGKAPPLVAAFMALICLLALPLFSAADRVYRKKRTGNLLYVMLVFMVFFLARARSLVLIVTGSHRR